MNANLPEPTAFLPHENHMTALFPRPKEADSAVAWLAEEGVNPQSVWLNPPLPVPKPLRPANTGGPEGVMDEVMDEVADVISESFSDDEKLTHRVDKYREEGQTAISFPFDGDETQRQSLAQRLKATGASAIFFWGIWVTEQL